MNKVIIIGRLSKEPEIKILGSSGNPVASFSIATNRKYKKKGSEEWTEESSFFDVEAYGNLADRVGKNLMKGYQIYLEGRLKQDRWEKDGHMQSRVKIIAEKIFLLSKPKQEGQVEENTDLSEEDVPF